MGWLTSIYGILTTAWQIFSALLSLGRTLWQIYQKHAIEVASKEAAAKLKAAAITARTGDTSLLENWFSPGRNKKDGIENAKPNPDSQPLS